MKTHFSFLVFFFLGLGYILLGPVSSVCAGVHPNTSTYPSSSQAKPGDVVQVHYTGKLPDGCEFDSSRNSSPLEFTLGEGGVIPGFDQAIAGMCSGEKKTVLVPCEQAYGPRRKELITVVDRKTIPPHIAIKPGIQLQAEGPFGHPVFMLVTHVTDKTVTLDGNHQLAGKDLIFDIEVVNIP